ncbi:PadR family transcriptional regulator [Candidatus Enterococcus leclercqii]|uniref:PadR family transcriptional regulator n=1 Tax=Enterococcus TaxID=1350 RepID=UPI00137B3EC9|nr:PadR family transcriptional regulator [Enterococcus sp. CU9D]KAF1290809.1 transcriptional regulator [Enterococcus sp. CU9D]
MTETISKEMIRGHVETIVLNILSQGDSYGYAISKTVTQLSDGAYDLNEATLYTVFRRLEKQGAIESYWGDQTKGGRRKYYHLTAQGQETLTAEVANWQVAKQILDQLITGKLAPQTAATTDE